MSSVGGSPMAAILSTPPVRGVSCCAGTGTAANSTSSAARARRFMGPPVTGGLVTLDDTARGIGLGQHGGRASRVNELRDELAGHGPAAEAGRRQAADDPEIGAQRNAADQRLAIEREGHEP